MTEQGKTTGIVKRLWGAALVLATLGLIVLGVPYALSAHYLEQAGEPPAIADLEHAIAWDGRNVQARRALASAYLAQGRPTAALEVLQPALAVRPPNPLVAMESVAPHVAVGQWDTAIEVYESAAVNWPSAAAAAAYLAEAEAVPTAAAVDLWRQALAAEPGNLYALSRLWWAARQGSDGPAMAEYEDRLRYFDLHAVAVPSDARLADYQGRAMADLVEAGIWTRETLLNVVSYQVWQFAEGDAGRRTEQVLDGLLARWPDDADLRFYKAELYHRRGDLARARDQYLSVLETQAGYPGVYWRLGMVAEAMGRSSSDIITLHEATKWYEMHLAQHPDDPVALGRLVEINGIGDDNPHLSRLEERSLSVIDRRSILAMNLGVSEELIELGPELVHNGTFGSWEGGRPSGWRQATYPGPGPHTALYVAGPDGLMYDRLVMRILAIRGARSESGVMSYSDYQGAIFPPPRAAYLVSLVYSTSRFRFGYGFTLLGDYRSRNGYLAHMTELPDTGRAWHSLFLFCDAADTAEAMGPLVRNWGEGDLQFLEYSVRAVVSGVEVIDLGASGCMPYLGSRSTN